MSAPDPSLDKLADIVVPAPVSWMPQTWGWIAVAVVAAALGAWLYLRWRREREANRYRAEAIEAIEALGSRMADAQSRAAALAAIAPIVKRAALAAWPRTEVASLTGDEWIAFLRAHSAGASLTDPVARLLGDLEYRSPDALASMSADEAKACVVAAREWIGSHRVSA